MKTSDDNFLLGIHITMVATWLVRTVGKALLYAAVAAALLGILAVFTNEPSFLAWSAIVGPLVFAGTLCGAHAPFPTEHEQG